MTKKKKLIFIGLGIFLAFAILLPVGLLFYLETDHAQDLIQAKVNQAIPGTISWEEFRFSLLRGRLELTDVLLKGPKDDELAGFDRLFLDLSWLTLLKGDLTVSELTLESPRADIRIDKHGKLNLMEAFPPSKPKEKEDEKKLRKSPPFNIVVNSLRLANGSVQYEMEAKDLRVSVQEINLTGSDGDLRNQSLNLLFQVRDGSVKSPKINSEIEELHLKARLEEGRLDPLDLKIDTDVALLTLTGNVADLFTKKPMLDLSLDLGIALASIQKNFHLKPELTGKADLHLTAQGTADDPQADLRLNYGGGNLAGNTIDGITLACRLEERLLTLDHLLVNAASGDLNLQGDVDLKSAFSKGLLSKEKNLEAISYQLTLKEKGVNLEYLLVGNNMSGIVHSDIRVQGRGISPKSLSANLSLELSGEQLNASKMAAPIDLHVKTTADIDQGLVNVRELKANVGDISLQTAGNFHLASHHLNANLLLSRRPSRPTWGRSA